LLEELEGVLRECTVHLGEHLGGRGKKVERQAGRQAGRQLARWI
jgi:hypothetical protein